MSFDPEEQLELELAVRGKNAPRLTPNHIDDTIVSTYYHVVPGSTLTICVLTLRNGFQVTGEAACASPKNFDAKIGEKLAYEDARRKVWTLEGYLLKDKLHRTK